MGAVWSPLSGSASLIPACTPFSSSPSAVRVVCVMSMKKSQYFFLQGNGVATFVGQRYSQIRTRERFLVIVEIVETRQISANKNLDLATVYD